MTPGTAVLLARPDEQVAHLRAELGACFDTVRVVDVPVEPDTTRAARICAALSVDPPPEPITVVAVGADALLVPAVARGQRAAHRLVREYLLVEPVLPAPTEAWPDAPVTVISRTEVPLARLRGWEQRRDVGPMV